MQTLIGICTRDSAGSIYQRARLIGCVLHSTILSAAWCLASAAVCTASLQGFRYLQWYPHLPEGPSSGCIEGVYYIQYKSESFPGRQGCDLCHSTGTRTLAADRSVNDPWLVVATQIYIHVLGALFARLCWALVPCSHCSHLIGSLRNT